MIWAIVIGVIVIACVMELGSKERDTSNHHQRSQSNNEQGLGAVINEGLQTFNAGLTRINKDLELNNQASNFLHDFIVDNMIAVKHYESYAELTKILGRDCTVDEAKNTTLQKLEYNLHQTFKEINSLFVDETELSNPPIKFNKVQKSAGTDESFNFEPLKNKRFYYFNVSSLRGVELELSIKIQNKVSETLDSTKYDLKGIYRRLNDAQKILFDKLLKDLGEYDIFHHIVDDK